MILKRSGALTEARSFGLINLNPEATSTLALRASSKLIERNSRNPKGLARGSTHCPAKKPKMTVPAKLAGRQDSGDFAALKWPRNSL
jgi:hypothetical protein